MRSVIMKSLVATMCAAAFLAFGVAKAGEARDAAVRAPPGYRVVQENAHIRGGTSIGGFHVVDSRTILIESGDGTFQANLLGTCAGGAEDTMAIALDAAPGADIDRFAGVTINGRHCGLTALTKVERVEASR